ncbi:MAG: MFS transporter [Deltaproteobacteria bacterium]|nr:MFS transporter [Deltaproteobacteria bacterium]
MPWPVRYKVVGLLFLSTIINYADRVNISVAGADIMRETGWDKVQFGFALSAFLLGYALFQFPGGLIADRKSPRKVLAFSCLGFSLFTALTPFGQTSFALLLVLRFLVGACESASIPALAVFNSHWVPRQEFGRAQTVSISGTSIGQMLAYPTTTWLIQMFSWPVVFYFNAAVGFLWATAWLLYTTDTPREHPKTTAAEVEYIEAHMLTTTSHGRPSFWSILATPSVLLLCVAYMLYAFIAWIFILWFPTYLVEVRGFSRMAMGGVGMLPTFGGFLGMITGGAISDWFLRNGYGARVARARFPGFCTALAMPLLLSAVLVPSAILSIAFFVLFYFVFSLSVSGFWSMPLELAPRAVGAVGGVMNTMGNFAGVFGPTIAGLIITYTSSWVTLFYLAAGCGLVSGAVFMSFVKTDPIIIKGVETTGDEESGAARMGLGH